MRHTAPRFGFSPLLLPAAQPLPEEQREGRRARSPSIDDYLEVDASTHRRTALVALRGELDLVTVSKVAHVINGLDPQADGVRHLVLVDDPGDLAPPSF